MDNECNCKDVWEAQMNLKIEDFLKDYSEIKINTLPNGRKYDSYICKKCKKDFCGIYTYIEY